MPIHWRVVSAFALAAALLLSAVGLHAHRAIREYGEGAVRDALLAEARLAALSLPPTESLAALRAFADDVEMRVAARCTIVGPDGTVLADSQEDPAVMDNHGDRPEIREALRGGWGSASRHSDTLGVDMMYVALAVPESATSGAALCMRLSRPLTSVAQQYQSLWAAVLVGLCMALAASVPLSAWLAARVTRPVSELVRVARRVDRGDLHARVASGYGGELGELARVFNSALERIAFHVATSEQRGRYYAALLRQMSEAVVVIDHHRRVQFVNPAFARLFGAEESEMEGRHLEHVALSYELSMMLTRAFEQSAPQNGDVTVERGGESRLLSAVVTPLRDEAGETIGALGLLHDITDVQRLQQVRTDFVANASHELRTPASAVRALAEALEAGALEDPERGPRFVADIIRQSERLTLILDDMLTLTRVERGRELLAPSWLSARKAFHEAVTQIEPSASAGGIAVEVEVCDEDRIYADVGGLQTILANLLGNAVKYTPRGGRVALRGQANGSGYEIVVEDTGIGIPPEHQTRIFERFYRVDKARDRATGGTGLGLSIVKHTTEGHGGSVTVRSQPNEGSVFTVHLPFPPAE